MVYKSLLQFAMMSAQQKALKEERDYQVEQYNQQKRDQLDFMDKQKTWELDELALQGKINKEAGPKSVDKAYERVSSGATMRGGNIYSPVKDVPAEKSFDTMKGENFWHLYDKKTGSVIKTDVPVSKPKDDVNSLIEQYEYAVKNDGETRGFTEWAMAMKKSGASKVEVNTGKQIPAAQVEKIGEYKAYQDTLTEIGKMIESGKVDTGPFEFVKKRLDNWGVMPKEERIKLRTLVARLPGLLYAMRGKQLSDKEFTVAMNMMPKMDVDEKVFVIEYQKFNEYLNTVLQGKQKAYKGGGYDIGAFGTQGTQNRPPLDKIFGETIGN